MALSATIAVSPSTVLINQNSVATLTISNSGGANVNVTGVSPQVVFTGAPNYEINGGVAVSNVPLSAGTNVVVPAGGSLILPFNVVCFSPSTGPIGAGSGTYNVGAVCQTSDGSVFSPTAATLTVNPLPLPVSEQ